VGPCPAAGCEAGLLSEPVSPLRDSPPPPPGLPSRPRENPKLKEPRGNPAPSAAPAAASGAPRVGDSPWPPHSGPTTGTGVHGWEEWWEEWWEEG